MAPGRRGRRRRSGTGDDAHRPGPGARRPWWDRLTRRTAWPAWANAVAVVGVMVVTLSQLHPELLVLATTTAGGDTGAHVALPAFLESHLLVHGQLTGWDPGWYDGFPLYTFYFPLPGLLTVLVNAVVTYDVAFKLVTVLGSLLLPVCAWAFGRLARLRDPVPACLAAATLPFLFEPSFSIYGGNLLSTLAGEFSFSLGLSLSLLFLGVVASGLRTGTPPGAGRRALRGDAPVPPDPGPVRGGGGGRAPPARRRPGPGRRPEPAGRGRRPPVGRAGPVVGGGRRGRTGSVRLVARALRPRAGVHHQHGVHEGLRLSPPALPRIVPVGAGPRRRRRGGHGGPSEPDGAVPRDHGGPVRRRDDPGPGEQALQRPLPAPLVPLPLPAGRLRGGRGRRRHGTPGATAPPQPVGARRPPAHGHRRREGRRRPDGGSPRTAARCRWPSPPARWSGHWWRWPLPAWPSCRRWPCPRPPWRRSACTSDPTSRARGRSGTTAGTSASRTTPSSRR